MSRPAIRKAFRLAATTLVTASVMLLVLGPAYAAAEPTVSITDLIDNMKKYDGLEVAISGEAIGERMVRRVYAWITVNDDPYSKKSREEGGELVGMSNVGIAVWVDSRDTDAITYYGGYKYRGDRVLVTGTFNRACKEHGGDTDIHARTLEVVREGHPFGHPFQYWKLFAVIILLIAIVLLWNARRGKIKRHVRED